MSWLVLGGTGQVGRALLARAELTGQAVISPGRDTLDLADFHSVHDYVRDADVSVVFNAAAYTDVDAAESDRPAAEKVNAMAPGMMAMACAATGKTLVHLSTDYVYNGRASSPYSDTGGYAPLNVYGRTKLAGEAAVSSSFAEMPGGRWATLRTSWVFSATGKNFVTTMLRLARQHDSVRVVADQTGCPTPAAAIAGAMISVAEQLASHPEKSGTYNYCGTPATTWAGFARAIFRAAGLETQVTDIATADWPTAAPRPAYSVLDNSRIMAVFGLAAPSWQAALRDIVDSTGPGRDGWEKQE